MENYEMKNHNCCQEFEGESQEEILVAISTWWADNSKDSKMLNVITFTVDNEQKHYTATVHWSHLTPEQAKEVYDIISTPQELPVEPSFSAN